MYAAIDGKGNIIAYHDQQRAVKRYIDSIKNTANVELKLIKTKRKQVEKIDPCSDLYLVRYGHTFIQSGYSGYFEALFDWVVEEDELLVDLLEKRLSLFNINSKERKILTKAMEVVSNIEYNDKLYTPTLNELKNLKVQYDPYYYNINIEKDVRY